MTSGEDLPIPKKYEILQPIGRGGMGEVFLAKDLRLDRQVAIKYLREDLSSDDWQSHLRREAQLLAKLNHPNIVQIYDVIEQDGATALVMEYVDGRNLHIHLREYQVDFVELMCWLAEIAAGLAAAHEAGIVHNDLKAENVLIAGDGVAKITDFGIAKSGADSSADIVALGILAAKLLEGQSEATSPQKTFLKSLQHKKRARRPSSKEAATKFRQFWLESTQNETPLPSHTDSAVSQKYKLIWLALALLTTVATGFAVNFWFQDPVLHNYVAVLPTVISVEGKLSDQQQLNIRSTVQQALQQSVMTTPGLALVSASEVAKVHGSLTEIALAVGADELISSSLDCGKSSCELTIERLAGEELAVSKQRMTSILVDSTLESYSIVQRQWKQLYPRSDISVDASELISEEDFREYLDLHQSSYVGGDTQRETLTRLRVLLEKANRFSPIYDLYTHSALEMYSESGDFSYLDDLEALLRNAKAWAVDPILLSEARFKLAIERKKYRAAEQEIESIEKLGGDLVLVNKLWGGLYAQSLENEKAEKYYLTALSMKPSHVLFYNTALNYYNWGKMEDATAYLEKSLALYPNDTKALNLLGMIQLERGELDQAIATFNLSLELQPHAMRYSNLGLAYLLKGDYVEAKKLFLKAYNGGSHNPDLILNLADSEALLGDWSSAEQRYRSLTELESTADLWIISQAYAQLGLYQEAISKLRLIESKGIGGSESAFNAALVYTLAGQNIAALVEVERALKSNFGAIWFTLPWFDSLCSEKIFSSLLSQAGSFGRCANASGSSHNH